MRIVKLSTGEFPNASNVRQFFLEDLPKRNPKGKFRITPGRIAQLGDGERLIFTHKARVVFTGLASSNVLESSDDQRQKYPFYFTVDLPSLKQCDEDGNEFERRYNALNKSSTNII